MEACIAWHIDDEKSLGNNPVIASLIFGAERKFSYRDKTAKKTVSLTLEHGILLVTKDKTQINWLHCLLPTSQKISQPRINLTFRTIIIK